MSQNSPESANSESANPAQSSSPSSDLSPTAATSSGAAAAIGGGATPISSQQSNIANDQLQHQLQLQQQLPGPGQQQHQQHQQQQYGLNASGSGQQSRSVVSGGSQRARQEQAGADVDIDPNPSETLKSSLTALTSSLALPLQTRIAHIHGAQASLESQEVQLAAQTAALARENAKWEAFLNKTNDGLKEVGDVGNWAEMLERDMAVLEETLRLVDEGQSGPGV
jgi:hypothetical protein